MRSFLFLLFLSSASFVLADSSPKFLWGVGNSSFQVEGTPANSDWYRWTHTPGRIKDGTNADVVSDFWNMYDTDFKLAQEMGANAFRISIAWERIEPKKDVWDDVALEHYEKMLKQMRARGLEPVVTLFHFVLPEWLSEEGGVLAPDFVDQFAKYSRHVVERLALSPARVSLWMTINEPSAIILMGYLGNVSDIIGQWPPAHKNALLEARSALNNLVAAHVKAVGEIRKLGYENVKVSVAQHWRVVEPASSGLINSYLASFSNQMMNRAFLDGVMTGSTGFGGAVPLPDGKPTLDYLGINYYGRNIIGFTSYLPPKFVALEEGNGKKSDINWELYPNGLLTVLEEVKSYNLPILIAENGLADANDKYRRWFLKRHLKVLTEASKKYPIMGYLHWSLTDNFEWTLGLVPRFGLVEIDYKTLERKPRPSYYIYQKLIRRYQRQGF